MRADGVAAGCCQILMQRTNQLDRKVTKNQCSFLHIHCFQKIDLKSLDKNGAMQTCPGICNTALGVRVLHTLSHAVQLHNLATNYSGMGPSCSLFSVFLAVYLCTEQLHAQWAKENVLLVEKRSYLLSARAEHWTLVFHLSSVDYKISGVPPGFE